jgi:hypothetical protein
MKHDASIRKATAKVELIAKKSNRKSAVSVLDRLEKKAKSSKKTKTVTIIPKVESKIKKNKSNKLVQAIKPKVKKAEVVAFVKASKSKIAATNKPEIQKLKTTSSVSKTKAAEKKIKPNKTVQAIKLKAKTKQITVVSAPKSKTRKIKPVASAKQIKIVEKKKISSTPIKKAKLKVLDKPIKSKNAKPATKNLPVKKSKIFEKKGKQNTVAQKTKAQPKNTKAVKTVQVAKPKSRKTALVKPAIKVEDKKSKIKSTMSGKAIAVKIIKPEKKQISFPALAKTIRLERNKVIKSKTQKNEPIVPAKKAKAVETETVNLPVEKRLIKKKNKPIGSAIFRGRKDRYDFKVFPLDNDFEDVSAIYVISRRKIDREKKGHHALVCIGQTDSVLGEIKRHKNKCIKKHNANVISILPEANVNKRIKIEEDLRAAHAIACNIV